MTIGCAVALKPFQAFGLLLGLASLYAVLTLILFARSQWWVQLVPPLLAMGLSYAGMTPDNYVREQRERLPLTPLGRVRVTGREAPLLIYTVAEVADAPHQLKTAM